MKNQQITVEAGAESEFVPEVQQAEHNWSEFQWLFMDAYNECRAACERVGVKDFHFRIHHHRSLGTECSVFGGDLYPVDIDAKSIPELLQLIAAYRPVDVKAERIAKLKAELAALEGKQ